MFTDWRIYAGIWSCKDSWEAKEVCGSCCSLIMHQTMHLSTRWTNLAGACRNIEKSFWIFHVIVFGMQLSLGKKCMGRRRPFVLSSCVLLTCCFEFDHVITCSSWLVKESIKLVHCWFFYPFNVICTPLYVIYIPFNI